MLEASLDLHFGYVETGDVNRDNRPRQGLVGLANELTRRTAIEPANPMAVDPERNELIFFPMIYWPITDDAQPLSEEASARVSTYLQSGGLIIFDTQDADVSMLRAGEPHRAKGWRQVPGAQADDERQIHRGGTGLLRRCDAPQDRRLHRTSAQSVMKWLSFGILWFHKRLASSSRTLELPSWKEL